MKNSIQPSQVEPPEIMRIEQIKFWEEHTLFLATQGKKAIIEKAEKLLNNNQISQYGTALWVCKAREGYNSTIYNISLTENGLVCKKSNGAMCPGFNKELKDNGAGVCSHTLAAEQFVFMNKFNSREIILPTKLMKEEK